MNVTLESTDLKVPFAGAVRRVFRGRSEDGVAFFAMFALVAATNPADEAALQAALDPLPAAGGAAIRAHERAVLPFPPLATRHSPFAAPATRSAR